MTALQQREQTFKKTPHKARLTALCGVFLTLTTFGGAMTDDFFMLLRFPIPRRRPPIFL